MQRRDGQLDLFSFRPAEPLPTERRSASGVPASRLSDEELIVAAGQAGFSDIPDLAAEIGRRRLTSAVPLLVRLCRLHAGSAHAEELPEQAAGLRALAAIGGGEAAQAVSFLLAQHVFQGATLALAVACAADLGCVLPGPVTIDLLRHEDRDLRAAACRCAGPGPVVTGILIDMLDHPYQHLRQAAALALASRGRGEAKRVLLPWLRRAPTRQAIEAVAAIPDPDFTVLLGRIARNRPELADAVVAVLAESEDPQAKKVLAALRRDGIGSSEAESAVQLRPTLT